MPHTLRRAWHAPALRTLPTQPAQALCAPSLR